MIEVKGWEKVQQKLASFGPGAMKVAAAALYQEALVVKEAAFHRCPKDTGNLRDSHGVKNPETRGSEVSVTIFAGGGPAPYGIYVHENLTARHPIGEAKWLERTVHEAQADLAERINRRLDLKRAAG